MAQSGIHLSLNLSNESCPSNFQDKNGPDHPEKSSGPGGPWIPGLNQIRPKLTLLPSKRISEFERDTLMTLDQRSNSNVS